MNILTWFFWGVVGVILLAVAYVLYRAVILYRAVSKLRGLAKDLGRKIDASLPPPGGHH